MGKRKYKRAGMKAGGKTEIVDEYDLADIDKDEQRAGLERRDKRWKEIKFAQKQERLLEKKAIDEVEKMERDIKGRTMTAIQEAWLRCDFLLSNIMEQKAYEFMEWQRLNDPECYKYLYKQSMSPYMMHYAQMYVDYFARGGEAPILISHGDIVKKYRKYKGIKTKFKIVHKGEEEHDL